MPIDEPRQTPVPPANQTPAPRKFGRRGLWIGSVVAVVLVAGLGWLAWDLTNKPATGPAGAAASRQGGGAGGGPGFGGPGGTRGGPPTTVGVATAERTDIPITLEALGTVVPQATVRVRPQVSGVLQQVNYKEGQVVKKGDLLALIDPRQFEMALQQATGQRMRDEASLGAAQVTLQRYRTLLQQDSIARQEVDTQEALVKQLEAAVVIAKANEGVARLNLSYTRIVSPIAGRVGLRTVDVGNVVGTSDANGVAVVTQLSPIDVEFSIPQDQAANLQASGQTGPMEVRALDRTRLNALDTGTFASLDNVVDTTTGTVRAKARFSNAKQQMFPSQFVNVQLKLRTIQGAVTVPIAAVRTGANGDYVFVLREDRTVQMRTVQRGQATVDRVQVLSGLQPGEKVVTEGADRLRDGGRVTLPGDAPRQGASAARGGASRSGAALPPPNDGQRPASAAAAPATRSAPAAAAAPAAPAAASTGPTAEQRQRMLDAVKDDPAQLERRKKLLEALDRGDPAALERWQQMQQRRQGGG